ncbi:hypothetical protein [Methylobacterium sp. Leaf100]|uniref:hypothetical protein n=1 Tax=Methylobacterium sp. Leaf100 TaxID=1736252 RepID=UPI0006F8CA9A|nr:hypothetical protein [Methylobacterium sp. Leaf100]KQP34951.1 hypothetical protein ASF25_15545 [Methylobacterium sp. Leaf100]
MSTPLRLVALLALVCAGPAAAQTAPAERTWTDPPARAAAASEAQSAAEPARAAGKVPQSERTLAERTLAERTLADTRRAKPSAGKARTKATVAEAPRSRVEPRTVQRTPKVRVAAESRRGVTVRTLTPTRPDLRSASPRMAHAHRSSARPMRYGFIAPPPPPGGFPEDPRARRIRQAEAAGYLVVRRSTVAAPDGRILYGYRPYDPDDADD